MSKSTISRPNKGASIIAFPEDYAVIDIETTGFSPIYDSIIEISAIKYESNNKLATFSSLVKPESARYGGKYVSSFISSLTGITHDMLLDSPSLSDVLPAFGDFIGDSILIGHNVSFDINFIYDAFDKYLGCPLTNDYVNTVRISRKLHPEAQNHRLCDLSLRYDVSYDGAHRSLRDCEITKQCFDRMKDEVLKKYPSYEKFIKTFKSHRKKTRVPVPDIVPAIDPIDETNPLFGKVCVFTGTLEAMTRKTAMQLVVNYGGVNGNSVTKATNYLILGNNDYCTSIKDGKSNKQKKAEELKLKGQDIEIIPESVFLDMITES